MAKLKMGIIHPHAPGIDISSRSHFVAVGQAKKTFRDLASMLLIWSASESAQQYPCGNGKHRQLLAEPLGGNFAALVLRSRCAMGSSPKTSRAKRPM